MRVTFVVAGLLLLVFSTGHAVVRVGTVRVPLDGGAMPPSLEWPVVFGEPSVAESINGAVSYEELTGESMDETVLWYAEHGSGVVGSYFDVTFASSGLLSLVVTLETLGAYPSRFSTRYTFSTDTGERVLMSEALLPGAAGELTALLDGELQDAVEEAEREAGESLGLTGHDFTEDVLEDFHLTEGGVVFHYDFGFPHAAQALEPREDFPVSWERMQSFLDPEGSLGPVRM